MKSRRHLVTTEDLTRAYALRADGSPAAEKELVALAEGTRADLATCAGEILLGRVAAQGHRYSPKLAASKPTLQKLAKHFAPGDPLLGFAAVARHLLGEKDIGTRLTALDDGKKAFTTAVTSFVQMSVSWMPLTPSLVDLYVRRLGFVDVMIGRALTTAAPVDVLVHVLASPAKKARCLDAFAIAGLTARAKKKDATALGALLPMVAGRPIEKRLASLVAKLGGAKVKVDPQPKEEKSIGTDGGPLLLATRAALAPWAGSRADGRDEGDYHDACKLHGRIGALTRAGEPLVVLPSSTATVVRVKDEKAVWLILEGLLEEIWPERAAIRWKATKVRVDGTKGPVVLHDSAYPGGDRKASLQFRIDPAIHRLEEAVTSDGIGAIVRLVVQ